ncbi:MAG: T9SS type A sorting domain-containing protein [Candidatus Eisenbacteria bacterium]|uniref:T9SS type A sorting domain-containing protein n=1 Tax=Eiseniibacteriota bacterium TaxID=2212470 RepID=A0A933SBE2_UNCEI|nr:T9SS type A sorting domain-containing protein [Candidatus Eisenbacteria bacterium]
MLKPLALALLALALFVAPASAQKKALFDNTKAEQAGNADWIIDDTFPVPSPAQSGITPTSPESYWTGGISAFGVALVKRGYTVHTLASPYGITYQNAGNQYDLSNYDLFVIPEPNIRFSSAESLAIFNFVRDGGGLILIVDHGQSDRNNDGYDSPQIANLLDAQKLWGIRSQVMGETNTNIVQTSTNVNTSPSDSIITGPWGNATGIAFHNGTTFTLFPAINSTVTGDVWMTGTAQGSLSNAMVAHSVYGNGRVVYVGDSSPVDDGTATPGNTVYTGWTELAGAKADSAIFLNAAQWATRRGVVVPGDVTAPAVTVTSPNGGEAWKAGSTHAITWTATDAVGVVAVDIAYSSDGGVNFTNTIATGLANTGTYNWAVPNAPGTSLRVRVTARDAAFNSGQDASDANFTIDRWSIVASAGAGGTITPSGTILQAEGSSRTFTIAPSTNYAISSVLVDGASVGTPTSYTFSAINANHTIAASFAPITWTITASAGALGTIAPSGAVPVNQTASQSFAITPQMGAHVADVLVDGVSAGAVTGYTFTNVTAAHTIAASFAADQLALTVSHTGTGSVAKSPDLASYAYGSAVTVTATPATGWAFDGWTGDTTTAGNPLALTVVAARSFVAHFVDVAPPAVLLALPTGGEIWDVGSPALIQWTATDNAGVDSVDIDFSSSGPTGPWYGVAHGLANTGSYSWTVQPPMTQEGFVRVTARDAAGNAASDTLLTPVTVRDPSTNGVEDGALVFALARPMPNPSTGFALLSFSLPQSGPARVEVLDASGRRVAHTEGEFAAGRHGWRWDGRLADGSRARAGLYFVRLTSGTLTRTQRLVRLD